MTFDLIAAPHTPFHPDGSLNPSVIDRQADRLWRSGVSGAFVCGTTGEGMSLTVAERRAVAERWAAGGGDRRVIVHVGHACQADAAGLAAHAESVGAAGVAAVPPFYHKPGDEAAAVGWLASVAAAAPRTPFYVYDIPGVSGVRLRTDVVMRLAAEGIPTFAGVKFSNPDLVLFQECVAAAGDRSRVLFGIDEMLLAAVSLGAHGAVGSTYNFMAPLYQRLLAATAADDWPTARVLQRRGVAVVRVLERFGGLAAGKAAMGLVGVECGPVRPPLTPLDPSAVARLRQELEAVGFFAPDVSSRS